VRLAKDVVVLDANSGQFIDREEAPVPPRRRIPIEELRAQGAAAIQKDLLATPSPADVNSRNAASPPSSSETCRGSTTS
jgi:hypothetical protein